MLSADRQASKMLAVAAYSAGLVIALHLPLLLPLMYAYERDSWTGVISAIRDFDPLAIGVMIEFPAVLDTALFAWVLCRFVPPIPVQRQRRLIAMSIGHGLVLTPLFTLAAYAVGITLGGRSRGGDLYAVFVMGGLVYFPLIWSVAYLQFNGAEGRRKLSLDSGYSAPLW